MQTPMQTIAQAASARDIQTGGARTGFLILAALIALLGAGKAILSDTLDPDCFWHLRVADELSRQSWPKPLVDDLSFSSIKTPWTPYSWLAELGMKKLWDTGGYRAAVAAQAIVEWLFVMMLALVGDQASSMISGKPRYLASALASVVGVILSLAYLSFRPVDLALVLLAVIAWLLFRDRRLGQQTRAVWLVPVLTILMANIHFYALLVPLWTGALFAGDIIEGRPLRRGGILVAATIAASMMTPMLPGYLASVWNYAFHDVLVNSGVIAEMRPFYAGFMGHISAALVILILLCAFWPAKTSHLRWGEIIWLTGTAILLFKVGRMAPVFAIVGCPILAARMPGLSDRILTRPPIVTASAVILLAGIVKLAMALPPAGKPLSDWLNRNGPGYPAYPTGAADYVEKHVTPHFGRIVCEFSWGGYLEWRLPRYQMLMDGRTQVFPSEFWQALFFGTSDDRVRVISQSNADAAILPKHRNMFGKTLSDLNWKMVYQDDFAQVWLPPGS
jgi:hypothetical protein